MNVFKKIAVKAAVLILIISNLPNCASIPYSSTEPEFAPYLAFFKSRYAGPMPPLIIQFNDSATYAGACTTYSNGQRIIDIDRTHWAESCEEVKKAVIMHELGHCVLNRPHVSYTSYMLDHVQTCGFYITNGVYLDLELFEK